MNLVIGTFLITLTLIYPANCLAQSLYFDDEFNQDRPINTLDAALWEYYNSAPASVSTISEKDGNLQLIQLPNTFRFPFIVSKFPALPPGDFSSEIKFQYTKVTPWGTGISLSDNKPVYGSINSSSLLNISVWQDQTIGPNLRIHFNSTIVHTIPINTDEHIFKVDHRGNKYFIYLDNHLVYTSPETNIITKYIWLGHYGIQDPPVPDWTTFNIDYIRVSTPSTPPVTPNPTPTPTPSPHLTPVIFIPGIGGSELKTSNPVLWSAPNGHGGLYSHEYQANEQVWVNSSEAVKPGNDDYFDILRMNADGHIPEAELALTGNFAGVYQDTIRFFSQNGYQLGTNFFMFGYDWRRDITHTEPYLDQIIGNVIEQTGMPQVDIVAHSLGGLVARNYLQNPQKANKVRKLIELGVPHLGTTDAIQALHYGKCLTNSELENLPFCLGLNPAELKEILQNMISNFQLTPSQTYFSFYDGSDTKHPMPFNDLADIDKNNVVGNLNYDQLKQLIENLGHNSALFSFAENYHHTIDPNLAITQGPETSIIAGTGFPTLGSIIERNSFDFAGIKITKKDQLLINGDDSVPLFSSSLNDTETGKSISGSAKIFYTNQQHNDLVKAGPAMDLAKNILNSDSQVPSGISNSPIHLNGKQLSVHSPVNIDVYDQQGNHTGLDNEGNIEQKIPGSFYNQLDDAKFVWIPGNGVYNLKLTATDNGSFDFKIRNYEDSIIDTAIYQNIPITINSMADALINGFEQGSLILHLDQNGDQIIDQNIPPTATINGSEYEDHSPPEAKIYMDLDIMDLKIEGIDQGATTLIKQDNPYTAQKTDFLYIISDLAGNSLTLDIRKLIDQDKKDILRINSLQYNSRPPIILDSNYFTLTYKGKKSPQSIDEQNFALKGELKIKVQYDPKKDQSTITTWEKSQEKSKEVKNGLKPLLLQTNNGQLFTSY